MSQDFDALYRQLHQLPGFEGLLRWTFHGPRASGECRIGGKHYCGLPPEAERLDRLVTAATHQPGVFINDIEHTGEAYLVQVTVMTRPKMPQYDGEAPEAWQALLLALTAAAGKAP